MGSILLYSYQAHIKESVAFIGGSRGSSNLHTKKEQMVDLRQSLVMFISFPSFKIVSLGFCQVLWPFIFLSAEILGVRASQDCRVFVRLLLQILEM